MKTSVVGLGAMGAGIAGNLEKAGLLHGAWNRRAYARRLGPADLDNHQTLCVLTPTRDWHHEARRCVKPFHSDAVHSRRNHRSADWGGVGKRGNHLNRAVLYPGLPRQERALHVIHHGVAGTRRATVTPRAGRHSVGARC